MEEKKKTQGMRRDLGHFCGVFIISFSHHFGWCVFLGRRKLDEKENWEVGDMTQSHLIIYIPLSRIITMLDNTRVTKHNRMVWYVTVNKCVWSNQYIVANMYSTYNR